MAAPCRPTTIAGVTPVSVPMWRCQVSSQSKVWNGVQSAVCSNARQSCSIAARSVWTDERGSRAAARSATADGAARSRASRESGDEHERCSLPVPRLAAAMVKLAAQSRRFPSINRCADGKIPFGSTPCEQHIEFKRHLERSAESAGKILKSQRRPAYHSGNVNPGVCVKKASDACSLVLLVARGRAAAHAQRRARGAYRYRRLSAARVKKVGPAAERGDARAQAYSGFMYQYGRGVPQNYGLAVYWYRRAAEQGNATAQHLLGPDVRQGVGVVRPITCWPTCGSISRRRAPRASEHEDNMRLRDAVASKMSLGQLADAQYLARSAGCRSRSDDRAKAAGLHWFRVA